MQTRNKLTIAIKLLVLMLVFNGCDKVIEIELGDAEQMIVVNTVINPDSLIHVNLTRNRHILDNADIPAIEEPEYNPLVKLFVNGTYVEDLKAVSNGDYISTIKPKIGSEYSLEVSESKLNNVFSSATIPKPVSISYLDTSSVIQNSDDNSFTDFYFDMFNCRVVIDDPADESNYYLLRFEVNSSYWETHDTSYFVVDSALVNDKWIYDFREITSYEKYARHTIPGIQYVSNDKSTELAIGIEGYVFSDNYFNGNVYEYSASIPIYAFNSLDSTIVTANLLSLSEEYYKYLKSRENHYSSKHDFLATPVPVFNNINGGVGIMGSYSTSKKSFTVKNRNLN